MQLDNLDAVHERGLRYPDEFWLSGFSDTISESHRYLTCYFAWDSLRQDCSMGFLVEVNRTLDFVLFLILEGSWVRIFE